MSSGPNRMRGMVFGAERARKMGVAPNQYRVRSLAEALELAREYPEVIGYMVAPLSIRSGGARKWHGLDSTDRTRWLAESEKTEAKVALPLDPDDGIENVPPLPPSKIKLWELAFLDEKLVFQKPRILIDEAHAEADEPDAEPPLAAQAGAGTDGLHAGMIAQYHKFSMDCLKASRDMMMTVTEQHKKLAVQLQEELAKANVRAEEAARVRDMALGANTELHHKLAELESDNLIASTVQKVFEGKPELLVTAGRDLLKGVVDAMRGPGAPAAAAAA